LTAPEGAVRSVLQVLFAAPFVAPGGVCPRDFWGICHCVRNWLQMLTSSGISRSVRWGSERQGKQ